MLLWTLLVAAYVGSVASAAPPPTHCIGSFWIAGDDAIHDAQVFLTSGGAFRKVLQLNGVPTSRFCMHVMDHVARGSDQLHHVHRVLSELTARDNIFVYNNAFPITWQTRQTRKTGQAGQGENRTVNLTDGGQARGASLAHLLAATVPTSDHPASNLSLLSLTGGLGDMGSVVLQLVSQASLCSRVDFLEVVVSGGATCSMASLGLPGSSAGLPSSGEVGYIGPELLRALKRLKGDPDCRLRDFVLDDRDGAISEQLVVQSSPEFGTKSYMETVLYAVGVEPDELMDRLPLVLKTWTKLVPERKLAVFTEKRSNLTLNKPPRGVPLVQMKVPGHDEHNKTAGEASNWRGSGKLEEWSVFGRMQLMWDKIFLKDDDAKWLVLVDDATFVFSENLARTLSRFDGHEMLVLGCMEQPRIDLLHDRGESNISQLLRLQANSSCSLESGECQEQYCEECSGVPAPGMVILSRGLVSSLRDHIEECERVLRPEAGGRGSGGGGEGAGAKSGGVYNLQHAKLYSCIHLFVDDEAGSGVSGVSWVDLGGMHRRPWRGGSEDERGNVLQNVLPVSYGGFMSRGGEDWSTGSLSGDFEELLDLVGRAQRRHSRFRGPGFVLEQDVADQVECLGLREWSGSRCEVRQESSSRSADSMTEVKVY